MNRIVWPTAHWAVVLFSVLVFSLSWGGAASAEVALVAVDTKPKLGPTGVVPSVPGHAPEYIAVLDMKASPPKVIAEIPAATSVVGPPFSVAITPNEKLALVAGAFKTDPADANKTVVDDALTVIDLSSTPGKAVAKLQSGKGAAGIAINRAGTLALVANRSEGTVSVFTIQGTAVAAAGKVQMGDEKSGPSMVAITPDGKAALVTMDGDSGQKIAILTIDGTKVELSKREIRAGFRPFAIDIHPNGKMAVVTNIGGAGGDVDTISVIDLAGKAPRVVDTISLGASSPEGIRLSKDGNWCAVVLQDNSQRPPTHPYHQPTGKVVLFKVEGTKLTRTSEAASGAWPQGAEFSADGKTLLVGNAGEAQIRVLKVDGGKLTDTGKPITFKGGAVSIRTADK